MFKDKALIEKVSLLKKWAQEHEWQIVKCPNCNHNTIFVEQPLFNVTTSMKITFTMSYSGDEKLIQCLTCGKSFKQEIISNLIEVKEA